MSYILKDIGEEFSGMMASMLEQLNEKVGELSPSKTNQFIAKLQAGEFPETELVIVNVSPETNIIANSANIKDIDKLKDSDIPNVVGFIKADGNLCAYGSPENSNKLESEFGLPNLRVSSNHFTKNPATGKYEYIYRGKNGLEAEKSVDEESLKKILTSVKDLWQPMDSELSALLKSPSTTELSTTMLPQKYKLYALGSLNNKTKLSFDDILAGRMDSEYQPWKIADTLVVDTRARKYLSISNKLDKGVITIGGIPINEIRRCFKQYRDIGRRLGIAEDYIDLLRKMLEGNKPMEVPFKYATEDARTNDAVLGEFLVNLCGAIYRHGYVIVETSADGKISRWYPVNEDYVDSVDVTGCKFSILSPKKKTALKLADAQEGLVWTLGFKIVFTMRGRKYTWDFRDHLGNGSLTVSTIKRN